MTTIKQADREAAAELYLALDGDELTPSIVAEADRHRRGDYDLSPAVQAFARHREAAEREALERAAGVCRAMANNVSSPMMRVRYGDEASEHAADYCRFMESDIRALCPTPRPDDSEAGSPV